MKAAWPTDTANRERTLQEHIAAHNMIIVRRGGQQFIIETDVSSSGRLQCLKKEREIPEMRGVFYKNMKSCF